MHKISKLILSTTIVQLVGNSKTHTALLCSLEYYTHRCYVWLYRDQHNFGNYSSKFNLYLSSHAVYRMNFCSLMCAYFALQCKFIRVSIDNL